jgi:pyruvate-formate lyase-activating enzyme
MEKNSSGMLLENEEDFRIANLELAQGIKRLSTYSCIEKIELLPFHKLGEFKWENLSIPFTLHDVDEPSEHVIAWCRNLVNENTHPGGTS